MSHDEVRNQPRFHMYDDDDGHQSLFEAFVSHTAKDLGPIDEDWFFKERASQISECSEFGSSGSASSNPCTPVASPCLSRDKNETPASSTNTPASICRPPLWSPSLETPPHRTACSKQDVKVFAPRNLFHPPRKSQQSLSSENEDNLEDEEFKDVSSDREENFDSVLGGPKKEVPLRKSEVQSDSSFAVEDNCQKNVEGSCNIPQVYSTHTDHSFVKVSPKRHASDRASKSLDDNVKIGKRGDFATPNDGSACLKHHLTVNGTPYDHVSDMTVIATTASLLCQPKECLRPNSKLENASAAPSVALKTATTSPHTAAGADSSPHSKSFSSTSKEFSFSEDKSDGVFGRAELSLTQMFEVAESTIACIEAADMGFTQCMSSGSEAVLDSDPSSITNDVKSKTNRGEENKTPGMQLLQLHSRTTHGSRPALSIKQNKVLCYLDGDDKPHTTDSTARSVVVSSGFNTRSGKPVAVPESSLSAAKGMLATSDKAIMNDKNVEKLEGSFDGSTADHCNRGHLQAPAYFEQMGDMTAQPYSEARSKQPSKESMENPAPVLSDAHGNSVKDSSVTLIKPKAQPGTVTSGFVTARGKPVYVQEEALGHARQLLADNPTVPVQVVMKDNDVPTFFTTGTGKAVTVSVNSLTKSKREYSSLKSGFTTAGGKPVYLPEDGIDRARQFFSEACNMPGEDLVRDSVPLLPTGGDRKTTKGFSDSVTKPNGQSGAITSGFMTAGGKPVYVQEEALSHAQQLFTEAPSDLPNKLQHDSVPSSFTTGTGKAVNISVDSLEKSKEKYGSLKSGFKTAAGNTVYIQQEGLSRTRQLLSDDICRAPGENSQENAVSTLLAGGEGKMAKDRVNSIKPKAQPGTLTSGFVTACGKPVYVQEAALNRAHQLLSECPTASSRAVLQDNRVPTLFTTGTGKAVTVSADSLAKSKEQHSSLTSGFASGEGQPVHVKEGAVSHAHQLLSEAPTNVCEGSFQQNAIPTFFTTGSGKKVQVSAESLKAAQVLFDEKRDHLPTAPAEANCKENEFPTRPANPENSSHVLTSFKTGSDKAVSVSKKSLSIVLGKAQTPVAAPRVVSGPRTLFPDKTIRPGKLWILRRVMKVARLSLRDALQGQHPSFYSLDQLKGYGVLDSTTAVNSQNAADFVFYISSSDRLLILGDGATMQLESTEAHLGKDEFSSYLVPQGWLENHYRWIVWKLASMELHCPQVFGGRSLTPDQVMLQLKYRYDIEIDNSCRSALRKIYERDDVPSKTLVLCVSALEHKEDGAVQLELTDGWYSIRAELDEPLLRLASAGRLFVGLKLLTSGAELVGSAEACAPLEAPADAALKLSYNSTRRARWDVHLGYFAAPRPFRVSLASLHPKGGLVGRVDCLVIRAYPVMYLEMLPNGMGVMRHEKEELIVAAKHEKVRSAFIEKLTAEVLSQVEKSDMEELRLSGIRMSYSVKQIQGLNSGRDIWKAIKNSSDPSEIERLLSEEQLRLLRSFQEEQLCSRQATIQQKLESALQTATDENKCPKERVVIPVLKVLLGGIHEADLRKNICCLMCVWRPTDDTRELLKQGKALSIYNVNVTCSRKVLPDIQNSAVELTTTKMTQFEPAECPDHVRIYYMRQVTSFPVLLTESGSQGRAVDIVGFVLRVSHQKEGTVLTLTDARFNFVQLVIGRKASATEESMNGEFLSATDVTLRTGNADRIATLETTEFSVLTASPASNSLQHALSALKASIQDPSDFATTALARLQAPVRVNSPRVTPRPQCAPRQTTKLASPATPNNTAPVRVPAAISRTPTEPTPSDDTDGLLLPKRRIEVEPGSPADALSKQVRSKIALLERYAALAPISLWASPPSARAKVAFRCVKGSPNNDPPQESPPMDFD
ncbi:hypothetical protein MTO96_017353 [Rhipicephalus appendiculatus]